MAAHEKLKHPIVAEVILEIKFTGSMKLSAYLDELTRRLRTSYPGREKTNFFGIQVNVDQQKNGEGPVVRQMQDDSDDIPLYMFSGYQGNIFQLGQNILSVHTTAYPGFYDFLAQARLVINKHKQAAGVKSYSSISLRYLNLIQANEEGINTQDYIAWGLQTPEIKDSRRAIANNQQIIINYDNGDAQRIGLVVPSQLGNRKGMVIDIQHTSPSSEVNITKTDEIESWVNQAHEKIWSTFVEILKPEYLEELRNAEISDE